MLRYVLGRAFCVCVWGDWWIELKVHALVALRGVIVMEEAN